MGYKFNPFTGNLDTTDSPNGVFEEIEVNGDITLDDGGTYTTTLQTITPTAARTISFPDATGTVGLVGGSSGNLVVNQSGAYAGVANSSVDNATGDITLGSRFISSLNGAASAPPGTFTGTWFTGGTSTTTNPQVLIEPTGTTSTGWSTSGTGFGVNAASGFAGNLLDLQVNGTSQFSVGSGGNVSARSLSGFNPLSATWSSTAALTARGVYGGGLAVIDGTNGFVFFSDGSGTNLRLATGSTSGAPTTRFTFTSAGVFALADAGNITVGTTTGTKIGTATTHKLGFYNATPVVQPIAVADATDAATAITQLNALLARMRDLGLIAT
jgi:hypothetical protein